jgi:hypothetical protein
MDNSKEILTAFGAGLKRIALKKNLLRRVSTFVQCTETYIRMIERTKRILRF